jgi:hypothetical protein
MLQCLQRCLEMQNEVNQFITAQVFKLGTIHATRIPQCCKMARGGRE